MITTLTINPAIDRTILIDSFEVNKVNRVKEAHNDPGGKGINVSKVLHSFGIDTLSIGVVGGQTGKSLCSLLDEMCINHDFIRVAGNTRTNIKVVDLVNGTCTDINENGPEVSEEKLDELIARAKALAEKSKLIVLSGGVQNTIRKTIYKEIIEAIKDTGCKVLLDTNGQLLEEGIKAKPFLIKPNIEELSEIFGKAFESDQEVIDYCRSIIKEGIQWVAVSMGEKGLWLISEKEAVKAVAPKVVSKSTVGAGDSVVAAIAAGFYNNKATEEIIIHATAVGSASVTLEGTGVPTEELIKELMPRVSIKSY